MRFRSTRQTRPDPPTVSLAEALTEGLAPDGGLFIPAEALKPFPKEALAALKAEARTHTQARKHTSRAHAHAHPPAPAHETFPPARTASMVLRHLLGGPDGLPDTTLDRIAHEALNFPIPLVRLTDNVAVLELFHGPTLAFKDVGARVMARLLAEVTGAGAAGAAAHTAPTPDPTPLTILAATSGDTGGAVASAFFGVPGTRVVVLYPEGQVSPRQEAQFTTLGGNILALRVRGTFDDCQRMLKEAFADPALRAAHRLTSANSINVGRLLPQVIYHVHAWVQADDDRPLVVSVPSGNFGNLAAGLLAREMGLPIARFIAATNANDVVPAYLATGTFTPRPSTRTHASAMDVGDPSNLERIRALFGDDLGRLNEAIQASGWSDPAIEDAIRRTEHTTGYVMDPHTAVGLLALERALGDGGLGDGTLGHNPLGIVLATAHPAKFAEVVESILGRSLPVPAALAERMGAAPDFVSVGTTLSDLAEKLSALLTESTLEEREARATHAKFERVLEKGSR